MFRPSGLNRANVWRLDIKPCSMSRNLRPSNGNINFFSFSSSSLYQEMLSDVKTNQYGLELPAIYDWQSSKSKQIRIGRNARYSFNKNIFLPFIIPKLFIHMCPLRMTWFPRLLVPVFVAFSVLF